MSPPSPLAVVVGASGGLGGALARQLARDPSFDRVLALSRTSISTPDGRLAFGRIDVTDEASIAAAATQARALGSVRLVIVASGLLHGEDMQPEKTWSALKPEPLARAFAVNSIGPAMVGKHFLPLLPKAGRSVFAALSARIGSIEDNRLGGWYAYRASKAALNMLLKTFALELARRSPGAICIGLHPGTVDSQLSRPFQQRTTSERLFTPDISAVHLLRVIGSVTVADSGAVIAWDGSRVPA